MSDNASITFTIDPEESERARAWVAEHHEKNHKGQYTGAIGGLYTYSFTGTSIGTIATVSCACGAELDVSGVL